MDFIYLAGMALFFALLVALAYGCNKLGGTK
jgi:hypothetical protein